MKRTITFILMILPFMAMSQELSVTEFYLDEHDLTAINEKTKVMDDNNEVCALIKIETTQKGFFFEAGTLGVVKVEDNHLAEIWVYVPDGLKRITIKHNSLGTLRNYEFPIGIHSARTYIMKLVTGRVDTIVNAKANSQWLVLHFEPKDALVEIDDVQVDCSGGLLKKVLSSGSHELRISAKNYHTEAAKVKIDDTGTKEMTIKLKPAFGWIEVKGPDGATVFVDNEKIGMAPVKSNPIASGQHDVRVTKNNWLPYRKQVTVEDDRVTTLEPQLTANYASVTLQTGNNAEIWVNGEKKGEGNVTLDLPPGEYTLESRKDGHRPQSIAQTISMDTKGTIEIPTPVAILGSISIDVEPIGANVYVNDKLVGKSPLVLNEIPVGRHRVRSTYEGLMDVTKDVVVEKGKMSEVVIVMKEKSVITSKDYRVKTRGGVLIKVPEELKGDFVICDDITRIGSRAFYGCDGLTSVTIPNSVTHIGDKAFYKCSSLIDIILPNSVTEIGDNIFEGCERIAKPIFNSTVFAYMPASYQGEYTITDGIKTIAGAAFQYCSCLTNVTIPNSVTSIGYDAFIGCKGIKQPLYNRNIFAYLPQSYRGEYTIPSGIKAIAGGAFCNCSSLTNVVIPNSVTQAGYCAFRYCYNISEPIYNDKVFAYMPHSYKGSYTIPSGITTIAGGAFSDCKELTYVHIPNSVTNIGDLAFLGCKKITKPLHNDKIFAFMPESYYGVYSIPSGITVILDYAFGGCKGLSSLSIPNTVVSIGGGAFDSCERLKSIRIPDGVKSIGSSAFFHCPDLKTIYLPITLTSIGDGALDSPWLEKIYIPKGSRKHFEKIIPYSLWNIIVEK